MFWLQALKEDGVDLAEDATVAFVGFMATANRIGQVSFVVRPGGVGWIRPFH